MIPSSAFLGLGRKAQLLLTVKSRTPRLQKSLRSGAATDPQRGRHGDEPKGPLALFSDNAAAKPLRGRRWRGIHDPPYRERDAHFSKIIALTFGDKLRLSRIALCLQILRRR